MRLLLLLLLAVVATRADVASEATLQALTGPLFSEADFESAACRAKMFSSRTVGVIITGAAHSGTTVLESLINNMPGLYGGFELGFLEGATPSAYPFSDMLAPSALKGWNVSPEDQQRLKTVPCLADMYDLLREVSPNVRNSSGARLIDKCPSYESHLGTVLARAPPNTPLILVYKGGKVRARAARWLETSLAKQIFTVDYDADLLLNLHETMAKVYAFIGRFNEVQHPWLTSYANGTGYYDKLIRSGATEAHARMMQRRASFKEDGGACNKKLIGTGRCHSYGGGGG